MPFVHYSHRNVGWLPPKNGYFHYLKKSFLDQSIQKIANLILQKEALALSQHGPVRLQFIQYCITEWLQQLKEHVHVLLKDVGMGKHVLDDGLHFSPVAWT